MEIKITNKNGIKQYIVDGKIYNSFEELPDNLKKILEDKNQDGKLDIFEGLEDKKEVINITEKKYVIDGKEYNSLDEIPFGLRQIVERYDKKTEESEKSSKSDLESQTSNISNNKEHCPYCGSQLTKKSIFGTLKCKSCKAVIRKNK